MVSCSNSNASFPRCVFVLFCFCFCKNSALPQFSAPAPASRPSGSVSLAPAYLCQL